MKKYKLINKARFYSFIIAIVLIISMGVLLKHQSVQCENIDKYEIVTVQNGDTIWDIAKKYNVQDKDLREFVYKIKKENDMFGDLITPNQKLKVPKAS